MGDHPNQQVTGERWLFTTDPWGDPKKVQNNIQIHPNYACIYIYIPNIYPNCTMICWRVSHLYQYPVKLPFRNHISAKSSGGILQEHVGWLPLCTLSWMRTHH